MSQIAYKIRRKTVKALSEYNMLEEGDRVLVAVSGGIDSAVLLFTLLDIQRKAPFSFTLFPVYVNQMFPGMDIKPFQQWMIERGISIETLPFDTYRLLTQDSEKKHSPCQLCSRLRRGILYTYAKKSGFNKIAMGHNRDDLNETLLMNLLFSGKLASMPPKLKAVDGYNTLIRPLCYVDKVLIAAYGKELELPVVNNPYCEDLPKNSRQSIKNLLQSLEADNPKIAGSILTAQKNIKPSQLLDKNFWDFS